MKEKMYTARKAGELLGIKVRTVREWIHTGKLKAEKYPVSNRWFVSESEIKRLTSHGNEDREYTE